MTPDNDAEYNTEEIKPRKLKFTREDQSIFIEQLAYIKLLTSVGIGDMKFANETTTVDDIHPGLRKRLDRIFGRVDYRTIFLNELALDIDIKSVIKQWAGKKPLTSEEEWQWVVKYAYKLIKTLDKYHIPYVISFSGGAGIHVEIFYEIEHLFREPMDILISGTMEQIEMERGDKLGKVAQHLATMPATTGGITISGRPQQINFLQVRMNLYSILLREMWLDDEPIDFTKIVYDQSKVTRLNDNILRIIGGKKVIQTGGHRYKTMLFNSESDSKVIPTTRKEVERKGEASPIFPKKIKMWYPRVEWILGYVEKERPCRVCASDVAL